MRAIAYLSRINTAFTEVDLDTLLQDARQFNDTHDVSGVLLYNTSFFFQYIEGEDQAVLKVYERIQQSNRHEIVLEVLNAEIDVKQFSNWCMGFCYAPVGLLQKLSQENWLNKLNALNIKQQDSHGQHSHGLDMLMTFWNNMNANPSPSSRALSGEVSI